MTKDEMIKGLRYKAGNIKAHMEPEFFAEIANYLELQKAEPKNKIAKERHEDLDIDEEIKKFENNAEFERTHENLRGCQEFKKLVGWLRELKAYKEQGPCEDAISREAALEAILTRLTNFCGGEGGNLVNRNEVASAIYNLTSVSPKQKTGKILTDYAIGIDKH